MNKNDEIPYMLWNKDFYNNVNSPRSYACLEKEIEELKKINATLVETVAQKQETISTLRFEVCEGTDIINDQETALKRLRADKAELLATRESLQLEVMNLKISNGKLRDSNDEQDAEIARITRDVNFWNIIATKRKEELEQLHAKLAAVRLIVKE